MPAAPQLVRALCRVSAAGAGAVLAALLERGGAPVAWPSAVRAGVGQQRVMQPTAAAAAAAAVTQNVAQLRAARPVKYCQRGHEPWAGLQRPGGTTTAGGGRGARRTCTAPGGTRAQGSADCMGRSGALGGGTEYSSGWMVGT